MNLRRISKDFGHSADSVDFHLFSKVSVYTRFPDFGTGEERKPEFHASFDWKDVELLIAAFSKAKHPQAMKLQRSRALAEAIETFMASDEP